MAAVRTIPLSISQQLDLERRIDERAEAARRHALSSSAHRDKSLVKPSLNEERGQPRSDTTIHQHQHHSNQDVEGVTFETSPVYLNSHRHQYEQHMPSMALQHEVIVVLNPSLLAFFQFHCRFFFSEISATGQHAQRHS